MRALIYRTLYPLAKTYWFLRRPVTTGVKCFIIYDSHLLMVRHTYGNIQYTIVGGGLKKGESTEQALRREVKEEVNLELKNIRKITEVYTEAEYKRDTIHLFIAEATTGDFKIDKAEISEAKWFPISEIPEAISPLFKELLDLANSDLKTVS